MEETGKRSRPIQLNVRFDEEEFAHIKSKVERSKATLSQFVRAMLIQGEVRVIDFQVLRELRYEVNKVGVNINQIAKQVNENDKATIKELQSCYQELEKLEVFINQIIKEEIKKEI